MRKYFVVALIGVFGLGWLLYKFLADIGLESGRETALGVVTSEYSFDSSTIQQSIADNQANLFQRQWQDDGKQPTPLPTEVQPIPNTPLFKWTEFDYMRIVKASAQLLGKDVMNANLFQITFNTQCRYVGVGFQDMTFGFFRDISEPGAQNRTYLRQFITIYPQSGRLRWREITLSDVYRQNQPLDRITSHLPAEKVLQVAENLGGRYLRLVRNNVCKVSGGITEDFPNGEWTIDYEENAVTFNSLLTIHIDPYTGQGRIAH